MISRNKKKIIRTDNILKHNFHSTVLSIHFAAPIKKKNAAAQDFLIEIRIKDQKNDTRELKSCSWLINRVGNLATAGLWVQHKLLIKPGVFKKQPRTHKKRTREPLEKATRHRGVTTLHDLGAGTIRHASRRRMYKNHHGSGRL